VEGLTSVRGCYCCTGRQCGIKVFLTRLIAPNASTQFVESTGPFIDGRLHYVCIRICKQNHTCGKLTSEVYLPGVISDCIKVVHRNIASNASTLFLTLTVLAWNWWQNKRCLCANVHCNNSCYSRRKKLCQSLLVKNTWELRSSQKVILSTFKEVGTILSSIWENQTWPLRALNFVYSLRLTVFTRLSVLKWLLCDTASKRIYGCHTMYRNRNRTKIFELPWWNDKITMCKIQIPNSQYLIFRQDSWNAQKKKYLAKPGSRKNNVSGW
jgi:hypothetical protein